MASHRRGCNAALQAPRLSARDREPTLGSMSTHVRPTTLQLISHPLCPYVHRAAAFLTAKQVPFTATFVDLRAKPDWFLAISPRGKVPVLVTADGTALFESAVILEYLAETYAPQIIPADPIERARHRMWIEISSDLLASQYKIATAARPADRAAALATAREMLARFERVIAEPYFAGAELGLVDYATGPALLRFERLAQLLDLDIYAGLPRVAAWSRRLSEHPAFRGSLVADFDERFRAFVAENAAAAA